MNMNLNLAIFIPSYAPLIRMDAGLLEFLSLGTTKPNFHY